MIAIIDFGSQYTHLIKRTLADNGLDSKIVSYEGWLSSAGDFDALILSGGPRSVYEDATDYSDLYTYMYSVDKPVIGICYGMQLIAKLFGGEVMAGTKGEYGLVRLSTGNVWMSHRDQVTKVPKYFESVVHDGVTVSMKMGSRIHAFQFHPEVEHTENGSSYYMNILGHLPRDLKPLELSEPKGEIGKILCAFSGGVDSLVAAVHAHKIYGDKLTCVYVDTGMMRPQDDRHIQMCKDELGLPITVVRASKEFLADLAGKSEPEAKRKAIGKTFIDVFDWYTKDQSYTHLLQGTIYPDRIESSKASGRAEVIKSHHNVGGLPDYMKLALYEPLENLYKDEVRKYGESLGIPAKFLYRHPFPGPGLAIRCIGEITPEKIEKIRQSDEILFEELQNHNFYDQTWQAFTALLPVRSVGVKGDSRAYGETIAIRMVNSRDGMTASWTKAPYELLEAVSTRIMNEVSDINRVLYDISNKPSSTIEWE